jgi:integrase
MSQSQSLREQRILTLEHASEEYVSFIRHMYAYPVRHRNRLLLRHKRFVQHYPDLRAWFTAPLTERVGKLYREDRKEERGTVDNAVSYEARHYLLFLALRGYIRFDWEWLVALPDLTLGALPKKLGVSINWKQLAEEAVILGYEFAGAQSKLQWAIMRILLHIGSVQIEDITFAHLVELNQAIERLGERTDIALFYGSVERYRGPVQTQRRFSVNLLQTVLYHRGQINAEPPRPKKPPFVRPVVKPQMEAVIDHYLATRRLTNQPGTIRNFYEALHQFVEWMAQSYPSIETWAEVSRELVMEYAEALNTLPTRTTGRPLAATTRLTRLSCLSMFFKDVVAWRWEQVPAYPLLQHGDLPKRPKRVPRYIPQDELARLMPAVRALECPYQRTALLVARWSGARREEIQRLAVDCLDSYPDGTPRLRIPAGKTRQERIVPLNQEAAEAIRQIQALRRGERGLPDRQTHVETRYLFVRHGRLICLKYLFSDSLAKVCAATGLTTVDSKPTVTAHRFRHTVGTQLAQRGARLRTIQKILGHESPGMSMVYMGITDEDVRQDYQAVLGPDAVLAGPGAQLVRSGELAESDIRWIQENFFKTELELGRCLRLPQEGPCECDLYLTCAKFVTSPEYAPRLRHRRRVELELIEDAAAHGWQREIERHQRTMHHLEHLLTELGEPIDGPETTN